jgi:hypothetical protein
MGDEGMGAAALAGRPLRSGPRGAAGVAAEAALAFHSPRGPLVAVCGLVGGSGASTLSYLMARRAARHSSVPVLLAELQDHGGLAALTGAAGPLGLRELALAVDRQDQPAVPFAELPGGLRLVASPRLAATEAASAAALERVLGDAHAAHGLTVVDAGQTAAPDDGTLLAAASHVLFVLAASPAALRRVELLAHAGIFDRPRGGPAALVAVATRPQPAVRIGQLRRLAERHLDRLLLVPYLPELAAGNHDRADARLEHTFTALATLLRRPPR